MPRQMASGAFQKAQWDARYAAHIAAINELVDRLGTKGPGSRPPYVAPLYGGVNAELLNVLQDPGPMTQKGKGSGLICLENDDPTAENMANLLSGVDISPARAMIWNAYPWFINRKPKAKELSDGAKVFFQIINLLPKLRVVMLNGRVAQAMWEVARSQGLSLPTQVTVISTYHTSKRALLTEKRRAHVEAAFREAAQILSAKI